MEDGVAVEDGAAVRLGFYGPGYEVKVEAGSPAALKRLAEGKLGQA